MDDARTDVARRRWRWLPWGLLGATVAVASTGAWLGSRSLGALEARSAQLEREATESEAHVAQLQALRQAMERKLRALERQQQTQDWTGASVARTEPPSRPARRHAKAKASSKTQPPARRARE